MTVPVMGLRLSSASARSAPARRLPRLRISGSASPSSPMTAAAGVDSGDTESFAPEREYEDLAAVAAATGPEPPFVFGHSSGAAIALRAAAAGLPAAGIVAYEAPFLNEDTPLPSVDPADHIRQLVSSGRRGEAVAFWMSEVVGLPDEMLAQMEGAPWVKALEPLTHKLPYELAVSAGGTPKVALW